MPLVAVIDSGWNQSRYFPSVHAGYSLVDDDGDALPIVLSGTNDRNGHGTSCIKIILQHAPFADILPVRVFGRPLSTSVEHIAAAIDIAVAAQADLICLCLATVKREDASILYPSCRRADRAGIIVVAAADKRTGLGYPASFDCVIGVRSDRGLSLLDVGFRETEEVECSAHGAGPAGTNECSADSSSFATARVCGLLTCLRSTNAEVDIGDARRWLRARAQSRVTPEHFPSLSEA